MGSDPFEGSDPVYGSPPPLAKAGACGTRAPARFFQSSRTRQERRAWNHLCGSTSSATTPALASGSGRLVLWAAKAAGGAALGLVSVEWTFIHEPLAAEAV